MATKKAQRSSSIFIDANQYLNLFRTKTGKRLLGVLTELTNNIFITEQIVGEVNRNKLRVAERFLTTQFEHSHWGFPAPHQFVDVSDETANNIIQKLLTAQKSVASSVTSAKAAQLEAATHILNRVSKSEDEVSKALAPLFRGAKPHNRAELLRARERKERGNPPGKKADPLGDELSWEQLLDHVIGQSSLWIITSDSDYATRVGNNCVLNAFLADELKRLRPNLEVFCFASLDEGMRDFAKATGAKAERLPTAKESRAIKDELAALPPLELALPTISSTAVIFPPSIGHAQGTSRVGGHALGPNWVFTCQICHNLVPVIWYSSQPPAETTLIIECSKCGWTGSLLASEGKPT